jgi:hypothetical protein
VVAGVSTHRISSRLGAAFAALVRSQALAAASTALYRNQQIKPLPKQADLARRDPGKPLCRAVSGPLQRCPMLPLLVAE